MYENIVYDDFRTKNIVYDDFMTLEPKYCL